MGFFSTLIDPAGLFSGDSSVEHAFDPGKAILDAAGLPNFTEGIDMSFGAAGIVEGLLGGDAAETALGSADIQAASQRQSMEFKQKWLEQNRLDIAEAVSQGLIDLEAGFQQAVQELGPFTNLSAQQQRDLILADPSIVLGQPGTQAEFQRGIEDLQAALSVGTGGGASGRGIVAAQEFGQNFAATKLDESLSQLEPLIDIASEANIGVSELQAGLGKGQAGLFGATGSPGTPGRTFTPDNPNLPSRGGTPTTTEPRTFTPQTFTNVGSGSNGVQARGFQNFAAF